MTRVRELRTSARRRLIATLGIASIVIACSSPTASLSTLPNGTSAPLDTGGPSAEAPTLTPTGAPTTAPTEVPASPGTVVTNGFHFDDILRIQVDRLAVRTAPTKTARLVHQYLILGTTASDLGEVRLGRGNFVKVQAGPLQIADITWYLVWPAAGAKLDDQTTNWYDTAPMAGQPVPAWIATAIGATRYATLERRPTTAQIAAVEAPGLVVAGSGRYVSPPMPRHDAFLLYWAAASPTAASCAFKVQLVPDDPSFDPLTAVGTSTTSVKASPLDGMPVPWPVAGTSTWATFTLVVTGTCAWAIRLIRLEHD
ncbi:MAG TPA: hypothetical protein VE011_00760 [Candidatus Dormibacteraeota bacterium]|nr:hypothetical protein [Candidatus Dormibacteraeota bacterium]